MTDKERLESLKRNREWTEATGGKFYTVDSDDYKWLIKQAERVQELESEIENWQKGRFLAVSTFVKEIDLKKRVHELEQQNKRYQKSIKECLERMNAGGAGTRSFVYEILKKALEGTK